MMADKTEILKKYFGHDSFRQGQDTLAGALLSGRDVLGVMPTGAGKSLCYQVPAMTVPGVALVISPPISLMKDQVSALRLNGVPAAYINTSLTAQQQRLAIQRAQEGQYKLIYVAPERLDTPAFRQLCQTIPVSLVAVDEAHCVSQWGQDFRPDYLRIADFIAALPHRPPVGAFTATATARVSQDIVQYLGLRDPVRVTTGFDRPNLFFEVIPVTRKRGEVLLDALSRLEGQSGIVYCATRKNTESVCELLRSHGYAAAAYHAGLEDADRKQAQEDFQYDRIQIIVATNAFGMGIDKSNVRFVIHYNMPKSIEAYYQEAGRAGRDGDDAVCLLLFGKSDIVTARQLIYHSSNPDLPPETAAQVRQADLDRLRAMTSYAESTTCYRARLLHYFGQSAPAVCSGCSRCLPTRFPDARLTAEDAGLTRAERKARKAAELAEAEGSPAPVSAASSAELTPFAEALFERLRKGRSEIAQGLGLPAYLICDDRCLKDMAVKQPRTREELLNVFGIGRRKANQFGDDFLRMVAEGVADLDAIPSQDDEPPLPEPPEDIAETSGKPANAGQKWTPEDEQNMLNLWKQDWSVARIAEEMGRTNGSIIAKLKRHGEDPYLQILRDPDKRGFLRRERASGASIEQLCKAMDELPGVILLTLYDMGDIQ